MNLINGWYLDKEIIACYDNWLVVYDGEFNYMVFSTSPNEVLRRYKSNRLPSNNISSQAKYVEYFSNFDNSLDFGLIPILCNGGNFL